MTMLLVIQYDFGSGQQVPSAQAASATMSPRPDDHLTGAATARQTAQLPAIQRMERVELIIASGGEGVQAILMSRTRYRADSWGW
jgi:hypothetical protein